MSGVMTQSVAILHQDAYCIAVDKPPGIPVIPAPTSDTPGDCLRSRVEQAIGRRVWVVHRIDLEASGVVLFARTPDAHRALSMAFESRDVEKTYTLLAAGIPDPLSGTIDIALHSARRGKARPALADEPGTQLAITDYAVETSWRMERGSVSLVTAHPRTGRHHQLRVHFRAIGTPLLWDAAYGRRVDLEELEDAPCQRLALHAARIRIPAGVLGSAPLDVSSPLATDLAATVRWFDGRLDRR